MSLYMVTLYFLISYGFKTGVGLSGRRYFQNRSSYY